MRRRARLLVVTSVVAGCLAGASAASASPLVCGSGCFFNSIQAAINAAQPGATITIGAGSYYENIVVDKPVTLHGAGVNTIVYPATSKPVCAGGSLCGGEASNIILVQADNVTITSLWLKGDNPKLTSGVVVGGEDLDARNGIITNHAKGTYNGLTVSRVKVTGVYLRGIYASSGGTFDLNHNTVENVQAEEASIAIFDFGGSGTMAYNKVSNANDAISANWSTGTQFLNNNVSKSGSGLHTDNNGGSADVIKANTVRECKTDGYGIFVFVPNVSATVESNKISGCSVGLAAYGSATPGQGPTFAKNLVNGTGAVTSNNAGTVGAYLSTDQLGYGYGDVTATLSGNLISHFNTGLLVTQTSPTEGQPVGGQATVTASPNDSFYANGTGANGGAGTTVNAQNDWWGCAKGPNMGGMCNTAVGTVQFTPWLTAKP
ncbi:MAG TPA: right-handed parallel beta-helix repeat-containing protein [Solirubrobacteraceae bacterium]|nr:right-handed parallel beta-helix repeat-containing protein [Solirubrobacteraceae bacterium]